VRAQLGFGVALPGGRAPVPRFGWPRLAYLLFFLTVLWPCSRGPASRVPRRGPWRPVAADSPQDTMPTGGKPLAVTEPTETPAYHAADRTRVGYTRPARGSATSKPQSRPLRVFTPQGRPARLLLSGGDHCGARDIGRVGLCWAGLPGKFTGGATSPGCARALRQRAPYSGRTRRRWRASSPGGR
jgi:hypothetical protein